MKNPLEWIGRNHPKVPLFLTIPHSGETIPPEAGWLNTVPKDILLTDVDRYVDRIYTSTIESTPLPALVTRIHRYAADLNRFPEDVDHDSVENASQPSGAFPKGFHWVWTTQNQRLMNEPISEALHRELIRNYHDPFHERIAEKVAELRAHGMITNIYHLDCHSMPSMGTGAHRDSGQTRADVVISDQHGKSARPEFKDSVIRAFQDQGFQVSYNWPYIGGRITERYGQPAQGHHTIQIELNRAKYMDEKTREPLPEFARYSEKIHGAIQRIVTDLSQLS